MAPAFLAGSGLLPLTGRWIPYGAAVVLAGLTAVIVLAIVSSPRLGFQPLTLAPAALLAATGYVLQRYA